jgi:hypothetical protein
MHDPAGIIGTVLSLFVGLLTYMMLGSAAAGLLLIAIYATWSGLEQLTGHIGRKRGSTYKEAAAVYRMYQEASGEKPDKTGATLPGEEATQDITRRFPPLP